MSQFWKKDYELGFRLIDAQHQKYAETLDKLNSAIRANNRNDILLEVFDGLTSYINIHFETEEKYFAEFDYPDAEKHILKHREFISTISVYRDKLENGTLGFTFELIEYLENWLVEHLSTMDKNYVACFRAHGLI
jgi:hemerythrin